MTGQLAEKLIFFNSSLQILLREALKKTAKIVTSSLSGGRGVSQNLHNKTKYYRGGAEITLICWKFVEFSTFQTYNFEFKCPYHRGEGGVEITLILSL